MRTLRIKNRADEAGYFHLVSRSAGQEFFFDSPEERDRMLLWLRKAVDFCSVELYAYCIMSNHFHLLVKVPPRRPVSDGELLEKMGRFYTPKRLRATLHSWEYWERTGQSARVEAAKEAMRRRMFDVSWFVKTFKQAHAEDYNQRHGHSTSVWGGVRFKSVYLERDATTLLSVAAYIHLNPVRAGMVSAPEDYRWSSLGGAAASSGPARDGLLSLLSEVLPGKHAWDAAFPALSGLSERLPGAGPSSGAQEKGSDPFSADTKSAKSGGKDWKTFVRTKDAVWTRALVLGSRRFIERLYASALPDTFAARRKRRKTRDAAPCLVSGGEPVQAASGASRDA